jgi:hypothetical protein
MATTTNYSWSTPDDTALVKDGAAAIRSLGTAIDTTVFNNAGAAIAKTIVDAKGDIIAATAADTVARLPVGTNGQVLLADSAETTGLKWGSPPSGKVLQVVQATTTTATTISSTTYADTTLTATITPTSATSKVLVMFSQVSSTARNDIEAGSGIRLLRGATAVYEPATGGFETQYIYGTGIGSSGTNIKGIISASYLDSPATTSATTYKTQSRTQNSTNSPSVKLNEGISTIILMEIGA